jgi:hypothetical protein
MYDFLYSAEIFGDIFKSSEAALRYKQLLPTLLTSVDTILYSKVDSILKDTFTHLSNLIHKTKLSESLHYVQQVIIDRFSDSKTLFRGLIVTCAPKLNSHNPNTPLS